MKLKINRIIKIMAPCLVLLFLCVFKINGFCASSSEAELLGICFDGNGAVVRGNNNTYKDSHDGTTVYRIDSNSRIMILDTDSAVNTNEYISDGASAKAYNRVYDLTEDSHEQTVLGEPKRFSQSVSVQLFTFELTVTSEDETNSNTYYFFVCPDGQFKTKAVKGIEPAIESLGDITLFKEADVATLTDIVNSITDAQKATISTDALATLTAAENKIAGLKVQELINNLPDTITLSNDAAVTEAKAAYDALTPEQKEFVGTTETAKLNAAVTTIADLKAPATTTQKKQETTTAAPGTTTPTVKAPAKVQIKTVKKAGTKKVTITWKKVNNAAGYEIWVKKAGGTYKCLKAVNGKNKVKYSAKLIKKGKYSFKVRAYRSSSSAKVYGSFSKVKNFKLK